MFKTALSCAALAVAVVIAMPAQATVITPVSVTASSTQTHGGFYNAENLIDGSGLTDGLHDRDFRNMWMTQLGVAKAELVFDLGGVFDLVSSDIWQFNYADPYPVNPVHIINTIDRGVKDFRILTSLDGVTFTEVFDGQLAQANGDPLAAQTIAFNSTAQFVKFDILSNYAEGTIYDPYASGLSEVRFNSAPVPEPATWAMMIAGFGLAGAAMRRRALRVSLA
jgi:PEP-CTERM putative exosortase interaction domain